MTQTLAILVDAYRNLNARKMFWVVLAISLLVALAFACVGINERGLKILFWQLDTEPLSSKNMPPALFYKVMFVSLGFGMWLTWIAAILALISTAGIFPDLLNGGAIDLMVSKPIGRLRLFLTQYAAGLLFVTLQVALFSAASFLVIGVRGGDWEPGLFVAIPIVVCFFSYLYSVSVLVGLVTRSSMAALLLTMLFWFFVWAVGTTENALLSIEIQQQHAHDSRGLPPGDRPPPIAPKAESSGKSPGVAPAIGRSLARAIGEHPSAKDRPGRSAVKAAPIARRPASADLADDTSTNADSEEVPSGLRTAHSVVYAVKTVLPKTTETVALLERALYSLADLPKNMFGQPERPNQAGREVAETLRQRSVAWVVGTSLGFEAIVLALAAWVFCRRDY